nr:Regulatory protein [Ipomoea batatas]
MSFLKEEKRNRVLRWIKTLFFLITMLISLLMFSAPILVGIADAVLPSALLSASWSPASLSSILSSYDFRYSLVDIPLVSIVRSAIILCVYSSCDGPSLSRGPYLGIATVCSVTSLVFVSIKASYVFGNSSRSSYDDVNGGRAAEMAMFACSLAMAIAHIVVAYRISCRERRKLLVYKIDIEAVTACKKGFSRYPKKIQEERVK